MRCIYCSGDTKVVNSRLQKRLNHTWRRRECASCHAVFTTEEAADLSGSMVVQQAGTPKATVKPFSRDKLFASVLRAVGHRKAPIEDAGALTSTIIAKLLRGTTQAAVSPSEIIIITHETLARFDTAAATQYQAYHPVSS